MLPATEIVVGQCAPRFIRRMLKYSRNLRLRRIAQVGHPNGLPISTKDLCSIAQWSVSLAEMSSDAFEIELKNFVRGFKFENDQICETFADPGSGFSLTDGQTNRAALAYPGFRASDDWRAWCDAKLKEHQKKPSVDREDFLFAEFCRERPDVRAVLAREKAAEEAKNAADEQAALVERLRRARAIRMRLESQGVDVKTIGFARKHVDEIPPDASVDEIRAAHAASENA